MTLKYLENSIFHTYSKYTKYQKYSKISKNSKYSKTRNIRKLEIFEIFENSEYSKTRNIRVFRKIFENSRKISKNSRNRIFENIRKFTLIRNEYFRIQYSINFEYFRTRNYFVDTLWYSIRRNSIPFTNHYMAKRKHSKEFQDFREKNKKN